MMSQMFGQGKGPTQAPDFLRTLLEGGWFPQGSGKPLGAVAGPGPDGFTGGPGTPGGSAISEVDGGFGAGDGSGVFGPGSSGLSIDPEGGDEEEEDEEDDQTLDSLLASILMQALQSPRPEVSQAGQRGDRRRLPNTSARSRARRV